MSQSPKDTRIIVKGTRATSQLLEGAKLVYTTVGTTFGPKGRNVLIEKPFGRPVLTRDGVTVARDTYFKERDINMGAQYMLEASETTNRVAGDGTSATVILGYHLLKNGIQAIAAGTHPMDIKQTLFSDSYKLLDQLEKLSKPVKKSQLKQVASVSCGDTVLGELIAGAIERVGEDGGIITERSNVNDIEREYVDGYYLQTGFTALQSGKKELSDPFVVVSAKRMTSAADANEILINIMKLNNIEPGTAPRILFVGNFEDSCYNFIVETINKGLTDCIIIKTPPQYGNMSTELLTDLGDYAHCQVIGEGDNIRNFDKVNIGRVDRVVATHQETTLFSDNASERVLDRIQEIKDRIANETVDAIIEKLRERIAKLEGKVALFKIGGATESEKEEKEFRVEDAIQATRAAYRSGIVAGGGITWLELSKLDISQTYKKALYSTFKKLLSNAGLPVDVFLDRALHAPKGSGFNLRKHGGVVDMIKEGIIDPTLVCEEVIKNATSSAASLLTVETLLLFEDTKSE